MAEGFVYKPALKYIPVVIAIGIALGIGDNAIREDDKLLQSIVLHTLTSLSIGLPLLLIAINPTLISNAFSDHTRLIFLGLIYALIGLIGSEIELMARTVFFEKGTYQPFSGGGMYLFNAILSIILGFGMMRPMERYVVDKAPDASQAEEQGEALQTIPVKRGEAIYLIPVNSISLIEAADKYAYAYDQDGSKHLCDYSLSFLEARLPSTFARIHRSYIVNVSQIARVQPFDKKRYVVEFRSSQLPAVKSSASYQQVVRQLIKL